MVGCHGGELDTERTTVTESKPNGDTPGTLYVNWLFEPGTSEVTWPQDDEIAARVMTVAVPPRAAYSERAAGRTVLRGFADRKRRR